MSVVFLLTGLSVQYIVLHDEDQVKEDRNIAKQELGWVARDAAPIVLEARVDDQLEQGENSTSYIEQDSGNAPTDGGFPLVVDPCLGDIFHNRDDELHIRHCVDLSGRISMTLDLQNHLGQPQLTTSIHAHDDGS